MASSTDLPSGREIGPVEVASPLMASASEPESTRLIPSTSHLETILTEDNEPARIGAEQGGSDADGSEDEVYGEEVEVEHVPIKKRRNKRSKPKSKRGLKAPTGLEEFFADAPITIEEHEEEKTLYALELPFINRILTAIQRFERTRRLTNQRQDVFYKYLAYGGVDVSPNMFQSVTNVEKKEMTKDELAVAMSQVCIGTDKYDLGSETALYEVDFVGCAKAFLSRRAIELYGLETREKTVEVTTTLERFMDYLYQHDVCPEYNKQVLETRDFCRKAADELCSVAEAGRQLPGDFNIACSTLFGGSYADTYDGETYWGTEKPGEYNFVGFTKEVAFQIIAYGMAGAAPETVFRKYEKQLNGSEHPVSVVETREQAGFEITEIVPPTKACLKLYRNDSQDFRPVGLVHARSWNDPGAPPEDLTAEERMQTEQDETGAEQSKAETSKDNGEYIFLVEQNIQLNLCPGMKIKATLRNLSCGIWFFDEFQKVYPSFDTFIPNELMLGYTKPRWLAGSVPYEDEQERIRADAEQVERSRIDVGDAEGVQVADDQTGNANIDVDRSG